MHDTIFALSTIFGQSGIAVIRISGPKAFQILPFLGVDASLIPRKALHTKLWTLNKDSILDDALIIPFMSPNSFNGEDILELHLHGSIAVINDVIGELDKIQFLRVAEPGEFTKIAFYNGKIDLTKAEGLADLLNAETSLQRHLAQKQLSGELEDLYEKWRQQLVTILAQLEALIDFPEDEIPEDVLEATLNLVRSLSDEISYYLKASERSDKIMQGINIVISGAPNVGKSSLLNLIAQKDVAIVSDIAGTTRDIVKCKLDLEGFSIVLMDTAGIRSETQDTIELEGIRRAKMAIKNASINITIFDNLSELAVLEECSKNTIIVINKTDLMLPEEIADRVAQILYSGSISQDNIILTSTKHETNLDVLLNKILEIVKREYSTAVNEPAITRLRQQNRLKECLYYLARFNLDLPLEIASQEIRFASECIGHLSGRIHTEEILDEVFTSFCIGK